MNQQLKKRGLETVDKRNPKVAKMFAWVEEQYTDGRVTSISPEEMMHQFKLHFPEAFATE